VVSKGGMKGWYEKGGMKVTERQQEVLKIIEINNYVSIKEISDRMRINISAAQKHVDTLKTKNLIVRIGPDKGGYWKVISK